MSRHALATIRGVELDLLVRVNLRLSDRENLLVERGGQVLEQASVDGCDSTAEDFDVAPGCDVAGRLRMRRVP